MARKTCIAILAAAAAALPAAAIAQDRTIGSESGEIRVETLADGLEHPWGLAFLPDGRALVTERPGRLRILEPGGALSDPLSGVPEVFAQRQGGLLDVAVDPEFETNGLVYLSYAEPGEGGASTAVARGRLAEGGLDDVEVIFRQEPKVSGGAHFGSRIAFSPDGTVFVGLGERFKFDPAQDLSNHLGAVVRVNPDGSVPDDNPFVGESGARPEIWSYGHRNIQGAAVHPETGALWVVEHGPRGGDEVNIAEAGRNYGWPLVSWGRHYAGENIPDPPTRPDLAQSVFHWTPVIAASGMDFYTADLFGDWQGDLLVGGLVAKSIIRLDQDGQEVSEAERLNLGARVRDVAVGPEGAVYALTDEDNGAVLRLTPADRAPDATAEETE
ncbi:PQQ-dependent sugar dehydrogenase [Arenibaculum sp.]|uniref:PQQ-dependent sugar dehydrogenase n=1 Tax=Arenibaculum sp. TaxID=2865862 RepID=UPI002E1513F7|nr:PQQ-dependent sugar dehydrogenase [Arenibaculum sp.]